MAVFPSLEESLLQGLLEIMQFRLTQSQWYLVNAKPGTNPTNPNGNSMR